MHVIGVIVQFEYGDDFDRERVEAIAHGARGRFEGLAGLQQKAFTVDEAGRRATNVYLWTSEDAARAFFDEALIERVGELYGVPPTVTFVDVAELVDNGAAGADPHPFSGQLALDLVHQLQMELEQLPQEADHEQ